MNRPAEIPPTRIPGTATMHRRPERITYRIIEAAQLLGISRATLDRWIKDELISSIKVRGLRFIPVSELQRLGGLPRQDDTAA